MSEAPIHYSRAITERYRRIAVGAAVIVVLVLYGLPTLLGTHSEINGQTYWWLCDDAMVSMRYARNIADGYGPVWNVGQRVEGFTNPVWTAVMVLPHLVGVSDASASLPILLLTLIAAALGAVAVERLVDALSGGRVELAAALVLYVLSDDILAWTTTGAETVLLMTLTVYALARIIREAHSGVPSWQTFAILGMIPLIRSDGLVLTTLMCFASFFMSTHPRRVLKLILVALLPLVAYEAFRIAYYGDPYPNTAYLKVFDWTERESYGLHYALTFLRRYALAFIVITAGIVFIKDKRSHVIAPAAIVFAYVMYVAWVGGDAFRNARFFVPIIPVLATLAVIVLQRLRSRLSTVVQYLALAVMTVAVAYTLPATLTQLIEPSAEDADNVAIGLWLRNHTAPTATVADTWAGSVFYFSHRMGVDLLGKTDARIAMQPSKPEAIGASPGHNKFDYDYSLGFLKPDYVVAPFKLNAETVNLDRLAKGPMAYVGRFYQNNVFREHYMDHIATNEFRRMIFKRDTSASDH